MRKLFFAFLLLAEVSRAQTDTAQIIYPLDTTAVSYTLDTIRADSFFLIEINTLNRPGLPRPLVTYNPIYFSDTTNFNVYIEAIYREFGVIEQQFAELERQKILWDYKYSRLVYLRDSVFNGYTGGGPKLARPGPVIDSGAKPAPSIEPSKSSPILEPKSPSKKGRKKKKG